MELEALKEETKTDIARFIKSMERLREGTKSANHNRFADIGPAAGGPLDSFEPSAPVVSPQELQQLFAEIDEAIANETAFKQFFSAVGPLVNLILKFAI